MILGKACQSLTDLEEKKQIESILWCGLNFKPSLPLKLTLLEFQLAKLYKALVTLLLRKSVQLITYKLQEINIFIRK